MVINTKSIHDARSEEIHQVMYTYIHVTYVKYVCLFRFLPISSRWPNAQHTTTSRTQSHVYNRTHCGRSAIPTSIRVDFIFTNKFDFLIYFLFLLWKFSYYIVKTENISVTTTSQSQLHLSHNYTILYFPCIKSTINRLPQQNVNSAAEWESIGSKVIEENIINSATSLTVSNRIKPLCAVGSAVLMVPGDKLLVIGSKGIRK